MEQRVLVNLCRLLGSTIAAHIRRYHPEPGFGEGSKLMTPRVPTFGEPVTQQNRWPATLLRNVHADAVGYDDSLPCVQRCHLGVLSRLSRSRPRGGSRCWVVDDFDRKDGREPAEPDHRLSPRPRGDRHVADLLFYHPRLSLLRAWILINLAA